MLTLVLLYSPIGSSRKSSNRFMTVGVTKSNFADIGSKIMSMRYKKVGMALNVLKQTVIQGIEHRTWVYHYGESFLAKQPKPAE